MLGGRQNGDTENLADNDLKGVKAGPEKNPRSPKLSSRWVEANTTTPSPTKGRKWPMSVDEKRHLLALPTACYSALRVAVLTPL